MAHGVVALTLAVWSTNNLLLLKIKDTIVKMDGKRKGLCCTLMELINPIFYNKLFKFSYKYTKGKSMFNVTGCSASIVTVSFVSW